MERPGVPVYGKRLNPEVFANQTTSSPATQLPPADTQTSDASEFHQSSTTTLPVAYTEHQPTLITLEIEPGLKLTIATSSSPSNEITVFATSDGTAQPEYTDSPPPPNISDVTQSSPKRLPDWAIAIIIAVALTVVCVLGILLQAVKYRRIPPKRRRSINFGMSPGSPLGVGQLSQYQLSGIELDGLGNLSSDVLSAVGEQDSIRDSTHSESMYSQLSTRDLL